MTNRSNRGSAPGRARPDYLRPGSFKRGHEKRGGRKRGTPNVFSIDYKKAILETAYRIGQDGNGKGGIVGYFEWVAEHHPRVFTTLLLVLLLEDYTPEAPRRTTEEINKSLLDYIGLTGKSGMKRQTVQVESQSLCGWIGQPFPVGSLMKVALADPKAFCKLFVAAFQRRPSRSASSASKSEGLIGQLA